MANHPNCIVPNGFVYENAGVADDDPKHGPEGAFMRQHHLGYAPAIFLMKP